MTAKPKIAEKKGFERLYSRAEIAAMSPKEYLKYEASLKEYRDSLAIKETNRREKKQAREEGRAEGILETLIQSIKSLMSNGFSIEKSIELLKINPKDEEKIRNILEK